MAYTNDLPDDGELVVATVRQVKNFGVVVTLDEYPDKEGFIHIAEVASGWVKYIRDHVREGQKIVCKVLGIDERKKNPVVDLSLKAVNQHQKRDKIQQWKSEQKAQKLLELASQEIGLTYQEGLNEFGYDLISDFGSLFKAFEMTAIDEEALSSSDYKGPWVEPFKRIARENIVPPYVIISGILELTSRDEEGMPLIKEALSKALERCTGFNEVKMQIFYVGAPRYRIVIEAPDYKTAESVIQEAAQESINFIMSRSGTGKFIRKT
ncbi:MAG: translation initiation factor IF-2 subunit alpha [Candidatus Thermoplasmatota archaeon]|nr:translation initiation factor IF-2 subunit alpha [Candidatus Thermoplasmatota archaeon]